MNVANKHLAERLKQVGLEPVDLDDQGWVDFLCGKRRLVVEWIKLGDMGDKEVRLKRVRLIEPSKE